MGKLDDGRTVFVPRTAPGDLVELRDIERRARFARARVARVEEPGECRATPRCGHYERDACGGCQLQHLDGATQRAARRGFVADALVRIGKLTVEVPEVVPAPQDWGYRTRITLAVAPGRRHLGFHPLERPDRVFPLERCEIARAELHPLLEALATELRQLPPDATHVVLRLARDGGLHLVVRARGDQAWSGGPVLRARLAGRGVQATIWWQPERGALRVVAGDRSAAAATAFEQVHPVVGDTIRARAVEALAPGAGDLAWDLYAGIGETSAMLAAAGATVESVELDPHAVAAAEARGPGAPAVRRHTGRVEERLPSLPPAGLVISNPPRAGMAPEATAALAARPARRLVYVSCDPATLARDLALLAGAAGPYRVRWVQPFDLFPQTAHVESVALLEAS